MANLRMKRLILEIVNNQLRDHDPPVTTWAYEELQAAGYSKKEAKEKIGAVVIEEIYDVMKNNQNYDEIRYTRALQQMVQQSVDFEDTYRILAEWDRWDELVQWGYEALEEGNETELVSFWWEAWSVLQEIMKQETRKKSISEVMEEQDYQYSVDAWLLDMEIELGNADEHEKRMEFCRQVLEMFDWTFDDADGFRCAIGEELYTSGQYTEGKKWFEHWIKKEPHNCDMLNMYSWCVREQEGAENAWKLIRNKVVGTACTIHNYSLFEQAKVLAIELNLDKELNWVEKQLESFKASMDMVDDFDMPIQQPIKKETKIYPNDPCPCGSGKKYKKCCGRN